MGKKMPWKVTILEVDNGYVVEVGCKTLVFESQEVLITELDAYMKGKETKLSEDLKKEFNQTITAEAPPQACIGQGPAGGLAADLERRARR